jgi:hypothetical protein
MSRDDWEDDEPRRSSRRWEEDWDDEPGPARSAVVTASGIIVMMLGCLAVLGGLCGGFGVFAATIDEANRGGGRPEARVVLLVGLLVCLVTLLWGVGGLVAGTGILSRRRWARTLAMLLNSVAALAGVAFLIGAGVVCFGASIHGPEVGVIVVYLFYLGLGLFFLGYAVWSFMVLLSSRYSVEFH